MIEVEVRGVMQERDYERVKSFLSKKGTFISRFDRTIVAYSEMKKGNGLDIRCRISGNRPELIAKIGEQGSTEREEIEVALNEGQFGNALRFMSAIGHSKGTVSERETERYTYKGVEMSLVSPFRNASGNAREIHSRYFEAEILADGGLDNAKKRIFSVLDELNVNVFTEHKEDAASAGFGNLVSKTSFYDYVDLLNREANVTKQLDNKTIASLVHDKNAEM